MAEELITVYDNDVFFTNLINDNIIPSSSTTSKKKIYQSDEKLILFGTLLMKLIINVIVNFAVKSIRKKQELPQLKGILNVIMKIH